MPWVREKGKTAWHVVRGGATQCFASRALLKDGRDVECALELPPDGYECPQCASTLLLRAAPFGSRADAARREYRALDYLHRTGLRGRPL